MLQQISHPDGRVQLPSLVGGLCAFAEVTRDIQEPAGLCCRTVIFIYSQEINALGICRAVTPTAINIYFQPLPSKPCLISENAKHYSPAHKYCEVHKGIELQTRTKVCHPSSHNKDV